MEGKQAYDMKGFHPLCWATKDVTVLDLGGFTYLLCSKCGVLCNMQAVSRKYQTYKEACDAR